MGIYIKGMDIPKTGEIIACRIYPSGEVTKKRIDGEVVIATAIPAVDAVEVVHGEWHEENRRPKSSTFYCSECKRTCYDIQPNRSAHWKKRCRYAYCPNCGARMDGRREDGEA